MLQYWTTLIFEMSELFQRYKLDSLTAVAKFRKRNKDVQALLAMEDVAEFVQRVAAGEDILKEDPAYLQSLLHNQTLQDAIVDLWAELKRPLLADPPRSFKLSQDVGFIPHRKPLEPVGIRQMAVGWQVTWCIAADVLTSQLLSPSGNFRRKDIILTDDTITLVNAQFMMNNGEMALQLEVTRPFAHADRLQFYMSFIDYDDCAPAVQHVDLTWGSYEHNSPINGRGQASFPDIVLADIVDAKNVRLKEDLVLVLTAVDPTQ